MPAQGRLPPLLRAMRLTAALSIIVALAAIATIVNGDPAVKSQALIVAAILFGSVALLGMAIAVLPYIRRKKDKNDPRP